MDVYNSVSAIPDSGLPAHLKSTVNGADAAKVFSDVSSMPAPTVMGRLPLSLDPHGLWGPSEPEVHRERRRRRQGAPGRALSAGVHGTGRLRFGLGHYGLWSLCVPEVYLSGLTTVVMCLAPSRKRPASPD